MHSKFIRLALFSGPSLLLVYSAVAQIIPAPTTPSPIPNPIPDLIGATPNPTVPPTPGPTAMPGLPPTPPPIPTVPPVSPPPVGTPTVPPIISPTAMPELPPTPPPIPTVSPIKPTPTAPPITPPLVITPTVPPTPTIPPTPTVPPLSSPPVLERPAPQAARAVIRYGPGHSLTLTPFNDWGRFQRVALQPGQVVTVVLQLSPPDFAKPADIQVLDGGAILDAPLPPEVTDKIGSTEGVDLPPGKIATVSVTGQLPFSFRPGNDIGLHRVSVIVGGNQYFFQFWRQNPSAPNNNPSMLRAY